MVFGLLLAILHSSAMARDESRELVIENSRIEFIQRDEPTVLISARCRVARSAELKCAAWSAYQRLRASDVAKVPASDPNPGAVVCTSLKGLKLVARDGAGHELLLCAFADGSMIAAGSLLAKLVNARAAVTTPNND